MKTIVTLAILIFGSTSFALSKEANLTSFQFDTSRFQHNIESAAVKVDEQNGLVQLWIRYQNPCPSPKNGSVSCRAVRPDDEIISLPLLEKSVGNCGITVYKAQIPSRALDVSLETFIVSDLSSLTCRMKIAQNKMTQVQYGYSLPGETDLLENVSVFYGETLKEEIF
jgi:hypothetical protein